MIIDCEQGSEDWLKLRQSKITASDMGVIMGHSRWSTIKQLWQRKLGFLDPIEQSYWMERGLTLEPFARVLANKQLKDEFNPCVVVLDSHTWAMASLDGINKTRSTIIEIKCPGKKSHEIAVRGEIQQIYKDQMFWQMFCSETSHGYFFSYNPDHKIKTVFIELNLDYEYLTKEMIPRAKEFYENLINQKEPDET